MRQQTIRELKEQLRRMERSRAGGERKAESREPEGKAVGGQRSAVSQSQTERELVEEDLWPEGLFNPGTLTEWISAEEGGGAMTLALLATREVVAAHGVLVVLDPAEEFSPLALAGLGFDLERVMVVRPRTSRETLWAWEQSLRCPGVAVSVGWLAELPDRAFRRLQLAAETGGRLGFLLRPATARGQPTWADLRLWVQPLPALSAMSGRRLRMEVLRDRKGTCGGSVDMELGHETGLVRLVPRLAPATREPHAIRA